MNARIAKLLLIALSTATLAWAQLPPGDKPPHERRPMPPGPGQPPPIELFFEMMRQRNPEEFERLRRLRETDPAAFRAELAERIQRERGRRGVDGGPLGRRGIPPYDEREARRAPPARGDGDVLHIRTPELDKMESKTRELARAFREAKSEDERSKMKEELRGEIARLFDLRERLRRERVEQMRERLEKVEQLLADRAAHREAIIERRLNEMSGADATAW